MTTDETVSLRWNVHRRSFIITRASRLRFVRDLLFITTNAPSHKQKRRSRSCKMQWVLINLTYWSIPSLFLNISSDNVFTVDDRVEENWRTTNNICRYNSPLSLENGRFLDFDIYLEKDRKLLVNLNEFCVFHFLGNFLYWFMSSSGFSILV